MVTFFFFSSVNILVLTTAVDRSSVVFQWIANQSFWISFSFRTHVPHNNQTNSFQNRSSYVKIAWLKHIHVFSSFDCAKLHIHTHTNKGKRLPWLSRTHVTLLFLSLQIYPGIIFLLAHCNRTFFIHHGSQYNWAQPLQFGVTDKLLCPRSC